MIVTNLFQHKTDEWELVLPGVTGSVSQPTAVVLNEEHTLSLHSGERLLHRFVCSPSALGELCAGWLFTEGFAADTVDISCDGHLAQAQGVFSPSAQPEKIELPDEESVSTEQMLTLFHEASDKYARSHGVHECVIKGNGWHVLQSDIGRHNAMDKAVGAAILAGYDLHGAVMFTSGRINVQTVQKAARCNLGCLMSKAVITHDALLLARELGLKVLFSVKEDGYVCI